MDKFTKVDSQYLAITTDTPYYRRAIYAAKVLICILRRPTNVSLDQPEARVFPLIEEVEFVVNYVIIYGFDTLGTDDTGKMHRALAKAVDAMDVVLRKSDSDVDKQIATSVKEKAESLITHLLVATVARNAETTEVTEVTLNAE